MRSSVRGQSIFTIESGVRVLMRLSGLGSARLDRGSGWVVAVRWPILAEGLGQSLYLLT